MWFVRAINTPLIMSRQGSFVSISHLVTNTKPMRHSSLVVQDNKNPSEQIISDISVYISHLPTLGHA